MFSIFPVIYIFGCFVSVVSFRSFRFGRFVSVVSVVSAVSAVSFRSFRFDVSPFSTCRPNVQRYIFQSCYQFLKFVYSKTALTTHDDFI